MDNDNDDDGDDDADGFDDDNDDNDDDSDDNDDDNQVEKRDKKARLIGLLRELGGAKTLVFLRYLHKNTNIQIPQNLVC